MGCTQTKLKSKKDMCFVDVPLQVGRKMSKEEGIVSREYKINSTRITQAKKQILTGVSPALSEGKNVSYMSTHKEAQKQ
ncbi:unnamed protein product (macronuclear) [Paramecium tetraurelia]|uniref:Uncharacterized protein n=1 Tax=Paramecium tetraurelia TaxID=5888 RepID=A0BPT5_PARTE|nr:uncharacterized protein GSPATT00005302001 [Paramecium tetraurelia]CAK60552.1 unnamed protein product [Paramecium tetraurelia]|eukprot:XP_001427950.1 hypothetical protein (macronuclear) [Paramecium tetraurelia strain d4-2]